MKRFITLISTLLLAFSLAFTLVACSSGNKGSGGGGSEGGEGSASEGSTGLQEALSEQEWRDAFDFSNVSVVAELSENGLEVMQKVSLKFYGGNCYSSSSGQNHEHCGSTADNSEMFNFSDNFDKFTLKDGAYTLKEGETIVITEGHLFYTAADVEFDKDGKISSITIAATRVEEAATIEFRYAFSFFNYGVTDANSYGGFTGGSSGGSASDDENGSESSGGTNVGGGSEITIGTEEWRYAFRLATFTANVKMSRDEAELKDVFKLYVAQGVVYREVDSVIINANSHNFDKEIMFPMELGEYFDSFTRIGASEYMCNQLVRSFDGNEYTFVDIYVKFIVIDEIAEVETLSFKIEAGENSYVNYEYTFSNYYDTYVPTDACLYDEWTNAIWVRENEVPSSCFAEGGYDKVSYCKGCGAKVSSEHITVPPRGEHLYENYLCDCGDVQESTAGLEFELNADEVSYTLKKLGTCTATEIIVTGHEGLPVTAIADGAFNAFSTGNGKAKDITKVTMPFVKTIGNAAFYECKALKYAEVGKDLELIDEMAFFNCLELCSINLGNKLEKIGNSAFYSCQKLGNVTLPTTLTAIGEKAFKQCTSLNRVVIPDEVTQVGFYVFEGCTGLKYAEVGCVSPGMFQGCSNLEEVKLSEDNGITFLSTGAFKNCTKLETINIPASVEDFGNSLFYGCKALTEIALPDGITKIHEYVFAQSGITSIDIPSTVILIGNDAFAGTKITEISFPAGLSAIGSGAFRSTLLESVTLPGTLVYTTDFSATSAFANCTNLERVIISEGLEYTAESMFEGCTSLTEVTLPTTMRIINPNTFKGCSSLSEIDLRNVTTIGSGAFGGTAFTTVYIPISVTSIGTAAFSGCTKELVINCAAESPVSFGIMWDFIGIEWVGDNPVSYNATVQWNQPAPSAN